MRHRFFSGWLGAGLCSYLLLFVAAGVFSLVGFVHTAAVQAQDEEAAEEAVEEIPVEEELPAETAEEARLARFRRGVPGRRP